MINADLDSMLICLDFVCIYVDFCWCCSGLGGFIWILFWLVLV